MVGKAKRFRICATRLTSVCTIFVNFGFVYFDLVDFVFMYFFCRFITSRYTYKKDIFFNSKPFKTYLNKHYVNICVCERLPGYKCSYNLDINKEIVHASYNSLGLHNWYLHILGKYIGDYIACALYSVQFKKKFKPMIC